ncbi:hypothetical protein SAMN05421636_109144 [Pricia antarctica]|uniref:Glycine zipper family protein n=1 Tax=Pricia antarctica TaxID=641691 RepID=A0A1G7HF67_9FLAO|nr:hypothetical protein [Pricia antarctica]SDE99011.1 hypothetical protein SAMN05421636_109144 [Pricia antarctica]
MTLKNALNYFESLVSEKSKKSEIKVYHEFIQIIIGLEKRNLSETEIQSIERALNALNFNTPTENYNKVLKQFKKYLKDTFSLTPKRYYTNLGIALGSSFGLLFGVIALSGFERSVGISLGIGFGMLIGLTIGRTMDSKAEASGNLL